MRVGQVEGIKQNSQYGSPPEARVHLTSNQWNDGPKAYTVTLDVDGGSISLEPEMAGLLAAVLDAACRMASRKSATKNEATR